MKTFYITNGKAEKGITVIPYHVHAENTGLLERMTKRKYDTPRPTMEQLDEVRQWAKADKDNGIGK